MSSASVSIVLLAHLGPTLCDPMDCSPPSASVHVILQARILEGVAISFSRGSSRPSDLSHQGRTASKLLSVPCHFCPLLCPFLHEMYQCAKTQMTDNLQLQVLQYL